MKRKRYQSLSGVTFRNEEKAKNYYGARFDSVLQFSILFKVILDCDGNIVGTW